MADCQVSVRYGVAAPPTFWPYVTEQLCCLLVGEAMAALSLFLLLKFGPWTPHPEPLQRKYHRSLHFPLFMMIAGGASWTLSFNRRELHSRIFWCRLAHLQHVPGHADILTTLHKGFEMAVVMVGTMVLIFIAFDLLRGRDHRQVPSRTRSTATSSTSSQLSFSTAGENAPLITNLLLLWGSIVVGIPVDPYSAWKLYWQGTIILVTTGFVLGLWMSKSADKFERDRLCWWAVRVAGIPGLWVVAPVIAWFSLENGAVQCSFWEILSAQACLAGTTCVAAEFIPRSTDVETLEKETRVTGKKESS